MEFIKGADARKLDQKELDQVNGGRRGKYSAEEYWILTGQDWMQTGQDYSSDCFEKN